MIDFLITILIFGAVAFLAVGLKKIIEPNIGERITDEQFKRKNKSSAEEERVSPMEGVTELLLGIALTFISFVILSELTGFYIIFIGLIFSGVYKILKNNKSKKF